MDAGLEGLFLVPQGSILGPVLVIIYMNGLLSLWSSLVVYITITMASTVANTHTLPVPILGRSCEK